MGAMLQLPVIRMPLMDPCCSCTSYKDASNEFHGSSIHGIMHVCLQRESPNEQLKYTRHVHYKGYWLMYYWM